MTESGPAISDALMTLHQESVRFWESFRTAAFLEPLGDAWSPADNVRHLTKSVRAVTRGLQAPKLLLLLRFGRPGHPSRTFEEVRDLYRARLAKGASAGRFAPSGRPPSDVPEAAREEIMAFHADAVGSLCRAIGRWSERSLDRRQLPHPLLGPLTVREMLLFSLYHNQHHVDTVRRRHAAMASGADISSGSEASG